MPKPTRHSWSGGRLARLEHAHFAPLKGVWVPVEAQRCSTGIAPACSVLSFCWRDDRTHRCTDCDLFFLFNSVQLHHGRHARHDIVDIRSTRLRREGRGITWRIGSEPPPPHPARIPQKRIKRRVPKFCSSSSAEDEESSLPTPRRSASTPQTDGTRRGETSWTPKITPSFERRKPRYLITACIIIGTLSPDTTDAEAAACPSLILPISSTPTAEGRHVTALTLARWRSYQTRRDDKHV